MSARKAAVIGGALVMAGALILIAVVIGSAALAHQAGADITGEVRSWLLD